MAIIIGEIVPSQWLALTSRRHAGNRSKTCAVSFELPVTVTGRPRTLVALPLTGRTPTSFQRSHSKWVSHHGLCNNHTLGHRADLEARFRAAVEARARDGLCAIA